MADLETREQVTPVTEPPSETPTEEKKSPRRPWRRTLWIVIGILAGFVVYAYAFDTTEVSLEKITDETRQESLFRVLRALGNPDILTYEAVDTRTDLDYMQPCPGGGFTPDPIESDAAGTFTVDPPCADPRAQVTVSGSGFTGNRTLNIYFVPPNGIELRVAQVRTDTDGSFEELIRLPNRPDEEVQTIRVLSRQRVGSVFSPVLVETEGGELVRSPRWSENAKQTLDKIIETVLLALLATTAGTAIAVPLSFIAARNLMRDVRIPALQVGLAILGIPIGVVLGVVASNATGDVVDSLPTSALLYGALTLVLAWGIVRLLRMSVPMPGSPSSRVVRMTAGAGAGVAILFAGQCVAQFAEVGGTWFAENLPTGLAFLGRFVATNGNILATFFTVVAALAGAVMMGILGSRLGYIIGGRVSDGLRNTLTILSMAGAGALVALGFSQVIAWLYQIVNPTTVFLIPAVVGAVVGGLIGWRGLVKRQLGAGLSIYYVSRTTFNTLRSIEPLIMAIVFVIWVGLGPFAGSLALGLHTVAGLAKLYSEQVESIDHGPLEAVRATGATRLQTIVYGVVPQIVAPYTSFTMYRWDINVRMSTIIGFVGGGGIGFLLQQNIALLDYRAMAAQILAITIVVATMDYVSSRLRERFT
ncbi:MAG: ABC transporter permease subunit [Acidimicrobiia bacterium]